MASAAENKMWKLGSKNPSQTEVDVATALLEIKSVKDQSGSDVSVADLKFSAAKEVALSNGNKAIVVFVPFRLHKKFQKVQTRLIPELEKKFSGTPVVIIAQRTILSKNYLRQNPGQQLPRSRTLTAVHDSILEDIVYPVPIDGKRIHYTADGNKTFKIFLAKDNKDVEAKFEAYSTIYRKLTNRKVAFFFQE